MKRSIVGGLVGAAVVALTLPLGAFAIAAPALPSGAESGLVALTAPPPGVSKSPPTTETPTVMTPSGPDSTWERREAVTTVTTAGSACAPGASGYVGSAPGATSPLGVKGTTTADLVAFAQGFNSKRAANCLKPVPLGNFRYDQCMERRLFWMAEDPSTNPASAWGHIGTQRSDGVPSVGCDGNLAGGMSNTGATVAVKWWDSTAHRASLYKPTYSGSTANVCIFFAMTHGGIPNEPEAFTRAAARWASC